MVGPLQPEMAGEKTLGAVTYEFEPNGFTATISELSELRQFYIDDVLHEVYPPRQAV